VIGEGEAQALDQELRSSTRAAPAVPKIRTILRKLQGIARLELHFNGGNFRE
jgi:hypothetical protein